MNIKRILKAIEEKYGDTAALELCADGSGHIDAFSMAAGSWKIMYRFETLAELRAHLGIERKRDRKRIIQ